MMLDTPNPGSTEAIERGCRCPIMDNCYGKGCNIGGELVFWYTSGCPVHSKLWNTPIDRTD